MLKLKILLYYLLFSSPRYKNSVNFVLCQMFQKYDLIFSFITSVAIIKIGSNNIAPPRNHPMELVFFTSK